MQWRAVQALLTLLATKARDFIRTHSAGPAEPTTGNNGDKAAGGDHPAHVGAMHDGDAAVQQQEDMKRAARVNTRGLALLLESAIRAVPQPLLEHSIYKCLPSLLFRIHCFVSQPKTRPKKS